jgi:exonuclease SbcC
LIKEQSQRLEDVQTTVCPICEQSLTPTHRQEMLKRNNSRLEEMRANYRDASKQVQTLEATLQEAQTALKKWQAALLKLPRADEAVKVGEEVERAEAQLKQATSQVASLADAAQQVDATTKALAALGDPRRRYAVASEQANRRKGLEAQMAQAKNEVAAAHAELTKLQGALADFGDLEGQLDAVAATLQAHRAAYQTVLSNQRQAEAVAQRAQEAATLAQEMAGLKASSTELEGQHRAAAANFDAGAYAQAAAREQELQREVGTLRGQLTSLESSQQKAERELADLRTLTAAVAAAEGKLKQLTDEEEVLETIRGKIRQAGPYISATLNRQISDGARQIFSDLMQDYSRNLTWNEDYSISLEVDGRQRSFSQLSGGEQMSAALSVRLALLREMSNIDIAFFDEPTANLDEVRREALARQILHVKGFKQLFVISHDDTFEQATQNLIRVERVSGTSRVVAG